MKVEDLYLACACGTGDSRAIRAFDAAYSHVVETAYRRFRYLARGAEDVKQLIHEKLFVAEAGKAPKIADYAGRGDLKTWLRVSVVRLLINISGRESREIP